MSEAQMNPQISEQADTTDDLYKQYEGQDIDTLLKVMLTWESISDNCSPGILQ